MRSGLTVDIYRASGYEFCSLGGISETCNRVLLVGDGVEGPDSEGVARRMGYPVVVLDRRTVCGKAYLTARPENMPNGMMGGDLFTPVIRAFRPRIQSRCMIGWKTRLHKTANLRTCRTNCAALQVVSPTC
jgi:hypothetical protein